MKTSSLFLLVSALLLPVACKPRKDASEALGSVGAGQDSNTLRALKAAQSYAERYGKAHGSWDGYFRESYAGTRRDFSKDTQNIRDYVMEQVGQNGRLQGQLDDSIRDAGYDEAVDAKMQATLDALGAVDRALRAHPVFARENNQTGVADASKGQLPLLQTVAVSAQAAILAVTAADAKKQASSEAAKEDALRQAQLLADLQKSAANAEPASSDFCSPFANPSVPQQSLARFESATAPMQYWLQAVDPTVWQNVPAKDDLKKLIERDGAQRPTFDPGMAYNLIAARSPTLQKLLSYKAGVWEGYTIGQHTRMVLDLLASQLPHSPLFAEGAAPQDLDLATLMVATLFLHDIGKGVPVEAWNDKNYQHEFTLPVLENMMCQMGFTRREVTLASRIVSHDLFGAAAKASSQQNDSVATEAMRDFEGTAREVGEALKVDAVIIFELQNLLYMADSGAYKGLRQNIMCDVQGRLELKVPDLRRLRDRMNGRGDQSLAAYAISPCNRPRMTLTGEP